jgi:hypothetical protein
MKTTKAYGLWNPNIKGVEAWSINGSPAVVRESGVYESKVFDYWADLSKAGYRVIPVTISYEPPAEAQKKGR